MIWSWNEYTHGSYVHINRQHLGCDEDLVIYCHSPLDAWDAREALQRKDKRSDVATKVGSRYSVCEAWGRIGVSWRQLSLR